MRSSRDGPWRVGDEISRLFLDLAASRPAVYDGLLSGDQLRLAYRHGLVGLLTHAPDRSLRASATPLYLLLSSRQHMMNVALRRVLLSLREAGVPATVLKGPYVASDYGNPALRTYNDLDLLVQPQDLDRALDVISADRGVDAIPPKRPNADKRDIPFRDPSGDFFNLDLHWDLFSYSQLRGCARGATAAAWNDAVDDPHHVLGPMWHLPLGTRLAFLSTHAILDHRFRLILFRDLAEIAARSPLDWDDIVAFAERWRLRSVTYFAWLMAAHLAEAPVPADVLAELRPSNWPARMLEAMLPRTDVVRFNGHRAHPVNLATVLLHDDFSQRLMLAVRAPRAAPGWARRVTAPRSGDGHRVTIVITSNQRRGAEVFGERLRDGLTDLGWGASLVALSAERIGPSTVDATAVVNRTGGKLGRLDWDVVRALRRAIRAGRPRILIAGGSATLQYTLAASFGVRQRPAVVYMSIGEPSYWLRGFRRRLAHRLMLSRVDLILAVSRETARQLVEDLGVPPGRVEVAHTGVPASFLEIEPDAGQPSGAELRLLFLGNFSVEKGPLLAIEAVDRLSVPARLRMVGAGPMIDQVHRAVERLDIADQVEVIGPVADVRPHLAWADLLVLTSKTEGLPGAVLEAAAAGVPAVAFDIGGAAETMVEGRTGRLVSPGDLDGMTKAIEDLADPTRRAAAGLEARELIRQAFTLEHSVRCHHELLLRLLREAET